MLLKILSLDDCGRYWRYHRSGLNTGEPRRFVIRVVEGEIHHSGKRRFLRCDFVNVSIRDTEA